MVTLGADDNHEEAPTRAHQGFLSYAPRENRERGRVAKQSPTREGVPQNFGTETYRNLPGQERKSLLIELNLVCSILGLESTAWWTRACTHKPAAKC